MSVIHNKLASESEKISDVLLCWYKIMIHTDLIEITIEIMI